MNVFLNIFVMDFLIRVEITVYHSDNTIVMASFDVSSLFTNIPLVATINIITDDLFKEKGASDIFKSCSKDWLFWVS